MKLVKYTLTLFISSLLLLSQVAHGQTTFVIETIAGNGILGYGGDGMAATNAEFYGPQNVILDSVGNVYVVDFFNHRVRKINVTTGDITTIAGNGNVGYSGDGSLATSADVNPVALAMDKKGNLYISDAAYTIRKVNTLGIINTIAGVGGGSGYLGFGTPALYARFAGPAGLAIDNIGNIYVADAPNNVIRKIDTAGIITTVAGNDTPGYSPDGSVAIHAMLDSPTAVVVDRSGDLIITDFKNNIIREVNTSGIISTYAGIYGTTPGFAGDNGIATLAQLNYPGYITLDTAGNLYIPDSKNERIRVVKKSTHVITTIAGNGSAGFGGDTYNALSANLNEPFGVAVDIHGSVYIADAENERVRKVYNPTLSVKNIAANSTISVYPNPSSSQVTLSGLNKSDKVCIYDIVGQQIGNGWDVYANGSQTFDINSLATGVYLLQVSDANGMKKAVTRLVKE